MKPLDRRLIRNYPRLHQLLLPWWIRYLHTRWLARNLVTGNRPISIIDQPVEVQLHPRGSIAEALWTNNFEASDRSFVVNFVKPGMTVLDIGANIGLYTILCAKLIGEQGTVHAFEPAHQTFAWLVENVRLNRCNNVCLNRTALGQSSGKVLLRVDPAHPTLDGHRFVDTSMHDKTSGDEIVECTTLDDYWAGVGGGGIDFIKIDIEGGEWAALQGGTSILQEYRPTLLMECTKHHIEVEELLKRYGYEFFIWNQASKTLMECSFGDATKMHNIVALAA